MPALPRLPPRRPDAHKGDFGRALLIGGSRGMAGAIGLAGMSCLRSGAGLVKLAVPDCILDTVASFEPAYMTVPLPCDAEGRLVAAAHEQLQEHLEWATCVACGPGFGRSQGLSQLVDWLDRNVKAPMVVDADGLFAWAARQFPAPAATRILTPHPGEWRRLSPSQSNDRQTQMQEAKQMAQLFKERVNQPAVVLLKGHRTYITDGEREAFNDTGNPGMATGGTGDVLTGVVTALVCQRLSPFDAAVLGAHVHGLAGDLAAADLGQVSLIASDLIEYLPRAFQSIA
jgi:ADP-dependent NAD(P)H-hydrate dehydratase